MTEEERYRATLYLDKKAVKTVRSFLRKRGQSFSGWMNALTVEFAKEIKGEPSPLNKSLEEMTLKEFGEVVTYWMGRAKGEISGDQVVKPTDR